MQGVTGGGLPAEIWHEAMVRIHADVPARPLPMINPTTMPAPNAPAPKPVVQRPRNVADQILMDVLGTILGSGKNQ